MTPIDRYLDALATAAPRLRAAGAGTLEEVRGHLEDAARDLQLAGTGPEESEREAIRRFGAPPDVAAALAPPRPWRPHAPRPLAMAAAALISAAMLALGGGMVAAAYTPHAPAERNVVHVQKVDRGVGFHDSDHGAALSWHPRRR